MNAAARVALALCVVVTSIAAGSSPVSAAQSSIAVPTGVLIGSGPNHLPAHYTDMYFKIFYRGPNGRLWYAPQPTSGSNLVGPPVDLGGVQLASAPSAVRVGNGYQVFYRGPNGHLWLSPYDGGQWWGAPVDLGQAYPSGTPSAAVASSNLMFVFYRGPNNQLFRSQYDGQWWSAPIDMGGPQLTSDPAVSLHIISGVVYISVFYRGPNFRLWATRFDGLQWNAPVDLGGDVLGGGPAATPAGVGVGGSTIAYANASGILTTRGCSMFLVCSSSTDWAQSILDTPSFHAPYLIWYRGLDGRLWRAWLPD